MFINIFWLVGGFGVGFFFFGSLNFPRDKDNRRKRQTMKSRRKERYDTMAEMLADGLVGSGFKSEHF